MIKQVNIFSKSPLFFSFNILILLSSSFYPRQCISELFHIILEIAADTEGQKKHKRRHGFFKQCLRCLPWGAGVQDQGRPNDDTTVELTDIQTTSTDIQTVSTDIQSNDQLLAEISTITQNEHAGYLNNECKKSTESSPDVNKLAAQVAELYTELIREERTNLHDKMLSEGSAAVSDPTSKSKANNSPHLQELQALYNTKLTEFETTVKNLKAISPGTVKSLQDGLRFELRSGKYAIFDDTNPDENHSNANQGTTVDETYIFPTFSHFLEFQFGNNYVCIGIVKLLQTQV